MSNARGTLGDENKPTIVRWRTNAISGDPIGFAGYVTARDRPANDIGCSQWIDQLVVAEDFSMARSVGLGLTDKPTPLI